jgi:hypothetical protein
MDGDSSRVRRVCCGVLLAGVVAGFAVAGCSDITPEPNETGGGVLDSPTHEADQMHQQEERNQ